MNSLFVGLLFVFMRNSDSVNGIEHREPSPGECISDVPHDVLKRGAVSDKNMIWPKGTVPFVSQLKDEGDRNIMTAIDRFHKKTCIRFVQKKDTDEDYVVFVSNPTNGCRSPVGRQGGRQELLADSKCQSESHVLAHMLMHLIGFHHEHSRQDRDCYINVALENVKSGFERLFRKIDMDYQGISYDLWSTMQYPPFAFSYNETVDCFKAYDPAYKSLSLHWRTFSEKDLCQIAKLYNCPSILATINCDCLDADSRCSMWKNEGRCSNETHIQEMALKCQRTCGFCCSCSSDCKVVSRVFGCLKDSSESLHALPTLLFKQDKDANPINKPENVVDPTCKDKYMEKLVCRCAEESKLQNFKYFGIGNYGECRSGDAMPVLDFESFSTDCEGSQGRECDASNNRKCCVGKSKSTFVYEIINMEKTAGCFKCYVEDIENPNAK